MQTQTAVAKGATSLYLANVFNLLANTAYFLVLTNFLGSTLDVGIITALNIMILLLVTICILAQPVTVQSPIPAPLAVLKFLSEHLTKNNRGGATKMFIVSLSLTGVLSGVLAAIFFAFPDLAIPFVGGKDVLPVYVRLSAIDVLMFSLAQICLGTVIALGDLKVASASIFLWSIVRYSLASLLLLQYAIIGVLFGYIIGDAFLFAVGFLISMRRLRASPGKSEVSINTLMRYSAYTLVSALMGFAISQADKIFALAKQGLPELAIYNVAIVASSFTGFAPYALLTVLLPALSALHASNRTADLREMVRAYTRYVSLLVIPIAIGFASLTEVALRIFGAEYVSGFVPSAIVSIATGVTAIGSVYAAVLLAMGNLRWYTAANLLGLLALFVVSAFLTPVLGLTGPALGRACLLFAASFLYAFAARRNGFFELDWRTLLSAVGSSAFMGLVVFEAISWPSSFYVKLAMAPALVLLGAFIYLGCLRLLRIFEARDLDFALQMSPQQLRWLLVKFAKLAGVKDGSGRGA